jgi:CD109 antigen
MQGGAGSGLALTAYVATVLVEHQSLSKQYEPVLKKAITYIVAQIPSFYMDVYTLAIVAHCLQLANHSSKTTVLDELKSKAIEENGLKYWKNTQPAAASIIEISSYAVLTLLIAGEETACRSIIKYLMGKRNSKGGYESSQETVVNIEAITAYAKKLYSPTINMDIKFNSVQNSELDVHIDTNSALLLQKFDLDPATRSVQITANGVGVASVQLSCHWYVLEDSVPPSFDVAVTVMPSFNRETLNLRVCVSYTLIGVSNMALVEIGSLTGYIFDSDNKAAIQAVPGVKVNLLAIF